MKERGKRKEVSSKEERTRTVYDDWSDCVP